MLLQPKVPTETTPDDEDSDVKLDPATRAERERIKAFFADMDDDDEPTLGERAGVKTIICHLAKVNQENYEAWRDSMPDEYYYALVEDLSSEKRQKVLMRFM